MLLNIIILATTFLVNFVLAVLVFLKGKRSALNQSFAIFVTCVAFWTGSLALAIATRDLVWAKISFAFGSLVPCTLIVFICLFERRPRWSKKTTILLLPGLLFAVLVMLRSDLFFSEVKIEGGSLHPQTRGQLYPLFGVYLLSYVLAALAIVIAKLKKSTGIYRTQLRYVILGIFSFAIPALITNLFLPWRGINDFNGFGPLFSVIMVGVISYSILRYRFLEIKIVVETLMAYLLALSVTILLALIAQHFLQKTEIFSPPVLNFFTLTLTLLIFPSLKKFSTNFVESINRPAFRAKSSIRELAQELTRLVDLEEIIRTINSSIINSLEVEAATIAVFDQDRVHVYSTKPYPSELPQLMQHGPLIRYLNDFRTPLVKAEAMLLADPEKKENFLSKVASVISQYPIELYLPLTHQNKLIGVITLGGKKTGEAFSKREIEMLETLAFQAATAVSNGRLYKEIKDLNKNLKNKVKEQTKHLDRLLKLKEEFLKITSHQLRTPTTIVKGMLSMVLEGSLDNDAAKKRQYIEQAYGSAQNLERVIHGILDASDLAAGKLMMDFEPIDLKEIVHRLVQERGHLAKEKGLELKLESPASTLPQVSADRLKIREAIANLVDNAIRYTPQGEVCVTLESSVDNRFVTVCVKDTGIGVKLEDQKKIFKKFARTDVSTMMYPNGSGLGLYIVKEIVDAHRGRIEVESAGENKGSAFKITMPAS